MLRNSFTEKILRSILDTRNFKAELIISWGSNWQNVNINQRSLDKGLPELRQSSFYSSSAFRIKPEPATFLGQASFGLNIHI